MAADTVEVLELAAVLAGERLVKAEKEQQEASKARRALLKQHLHDR